MKIFSKLIGLIILKAILVTLFILVGLDSLAELIDESKMIKNNYGIINVTQYVLTKIPSSISEYFPFAVLIGCLFGVGQLASSNEILVIRATGVSKVKIFSIVSMPIFFLLALVLVADEYLNPYLDQKAEGTREFLRQGSSFQTSVDGLWINNDDQFINVNAVFPGGILYGVSRYKFDSDRKIMSASYASRATYNQKRKTWTEENVSLTNLDASYTATEKYVTRNWETDLTPELLTVNFLPPESLGVKTLQNHINFLDQQKINAELFRLVLFQKFLYPFLVLALTLVSVGTAIGPLRDSTMGYRIFLGVTGGVLLKLFQDLSGSYMLVYDLPVIYGVVLPIILCVVLGVLLIRTR